MAGPAVWNVWYTCPLDAGLPVALGWSTGGIDAPHLHLRMTEIYLVARGTATARVERETVELAAGDALVLAPGEAHTFVASSPDYLHFVVHAPALPPDEARADHIPVPRSRLGL